MWGEKYELYNTGIYSSRVVHLHLGFYYHVDDTIGIMSEMETFLQTQSKLSNQVKCVTRFG